MPTNNLTQSLKSITFAPDMKDYLGQELQVGDLVIYYVGQYREFATNKIVKITNHFVFIDEGDPRSRPFKQRGEQVIKAPK
jgi:hypothetical protein